VSEYGVEWFRYRPEGRLGAMVLRAALLLIYLGIPLTLCAVGFGRSWFITVLLLLGLPLIVAGGIPVLAALITSADIAATRDGIELHVLGPWVMRAPWDALRHSTVWHLPPPGHTRLTLLHGWDEVHAVYVPGMRLLMPVGLTYGLGRSQVFVVTPDHSGYERLLQRIEHLHHPLRRSSRRTRPWRSPDRDLE